MSFEFRERLTEPLSPPARPKARSREEYASGAEYVLVVLGKEYPKRYWTAFEEDQYQGRIPDGSVIPFWSPDQAPTFSSDLTDKGGIVFTSSSPPSEEIDRVVDDLGSALEARLGKP